MIWGKKIRIQKKGIFNMKFLILLFYWKHWAFSYISPILYLSHTKSSIIFGYKYYIWSHKCNLLANTSWVTSQRDLIAFWSRQAKLRSQSLIYSHNIAQDFVHLLTPVLGASLRLPLICLLCLSHHQIPFSAGMLYTWDTKKAIVIQFITSWSDCDSHKYNHLCYTLDEVIWLS